MLMQSIRLRKKGRRAFRLTLTPTFWHSDDLTERILQLRMFTVSKYDVAKANENLLELLRWEHKFCGFVYKKKQV